LQAHCLKWILKESINNHELLRVAEEKLRKQKEIRRTILRDSQASSEIDDCLKQSAMLLQEFMKPDYRICEVDAVLKDGVLSIGNCEISESPLLKAITKNSKFFLYLITLNYDSEAMMKRLESDYVLYHFQHILGRESLFALGRNLFDDYSKVYSNLKLKRHPIKMRKESYEISNTDCNEGEDNYWDPTVVTNLKEYFKGDDMGVQVTPSGCFSPLQTILGIMVGNEDAKNL
jgi:hypothetical protein